MSRPLARLFRAASVDLGEPFRREAPTAFERAIGRQAVRVRNGGRRLFSAAGSIRDASDCNPPALQRETK
jgi:hypothetical protein